MSGANMIKYPANIGQVWNKYKIQMLAKIMHRVGGNSLTEQFAGRTTLSHQYVPAQMVCSFEILNPHM